jgi:hypothetical protein
VDGQSRGTNPFGLECLCLQGVSQVCRSLSDVRVEDAIGGLGAGSKKCRSRIRKPLFSSDHLEYNEKTLHK